MCGLHYDTVGGILGDDMGLGKTCQTVTFLGGCDRSMPKFRYLLFLEILCPYRVGVVCISRTDIVYSIPHRFVAPQGPDP